MSKSGATKTFQDRGTKEAPQIAVPREDMPPVGQVLRRARKHYGLAIREVGRRLGRSSAYLSQIERGLIRQPDPAVLLELAELYKLDFMTLAKWAGWIGGPERPPGNTNSATHLVRRVMELDDAQRAEILGLIEKMLHNNRT